MPQPGHQHGPLGRCGHTIVDAHDLIANITKTFTLEIADSALVFERRRNEYGVRPHGWFGSRFGFSPHRCDTCKRKQELEQTLVCPCCYRSITPCTLVHVAPKESVAAIDRHGGTYLDDIATTTVDDDYFVICDDCCSVVLHEPAVRWLWNGMMLRAHPDMDDTLGGLFL